jgi:hypothetical protein
MSHPHRFSRLLACCLLAAGLLLAAGCSDDDDPTAPPPPVPGEFADSPDQLMVNYRDAYASLDSLDYAATLAPGFRFMFSSADIADRELLTDHMNRTEELNSAYNKFSGELVDQPGAIEAGISDILFERLEPVDGWSDADSASGFPGARRRAYLVSITMERPGNASLVIEGQQEFFVQGRDSLVDGATRTFFQLVGQRDLTVAAGKADQVRTWGNVKLAYMGNQPPTAAIARTDVTAGGDPTFRFDAGGSQDADSGLAENAYRWQFGQYGDYTDWSAEPTIEHAYDCCPGEKVVFLQVRDRWGAVAGDFVTFTVDAIFPDEPDDVLVNFLYAYASRNIDTYRRCLGDGYAFLFKQSDVDDLTLPFDRLLREEDLASTTRLFSGQPAGSEPGVASLDFTQFEALTMWSDSTDPEFPDTQRRLFQVDLEVVRPLGTTILIAGQAELFVAGRDSILPGGAVRPHWELAGHRDLTGLGKRAPAAENTSWGRLKVLYF